MARPANPFVFEASGDAAIADPVLWLHILAGAIALGAGLGAIATTKGGHRHNQAGKTYVVAMAAVVLTAFPLSVWADNWFLFAIAIFSGYLVASGYRVILRRRAGLTAPTRSDYALQGGMLAVGGVMVLGGGYGTVTDVMDLGAVLVVFGLIGSGLALRELQHFRRPPKARSPWFILSVGRVATFACRMPWYHPLDDTLERHRLSHTPTDSIPDTSCSWGPGISQP
jgi:uncharacterized membrane protein